MEYLFLAIAARSSLARRSYLGVKYSCLTFKPSANKWLMLSWIVRNRTVWLFICVKKWLIFNWIISDNRAIGIMVRVFANGPGDWGSIPDQIIPKTKKKSYLMPPCLTLSTIRYGPRVKWSNPGNSVALSPTPRCSSYWKGGLLVTFD